MITQVQNELKWENESHVRDLDRLRKDADGLEQELKALLSTNQAAGDTMQLKKADELASHYLTENDAALSSLFDLYLEQVSKA